MMVFEDQFIKTIIFFLPKEFVARYKLVLVAIGQIIGF
jgi:hypothetical protein